MSHAEKCPVCNGSGKVREEMKDSTVGFVEYTCHACGGKGWVEVNDYIYPYYPYYPDYLKPDYYWSF